MSNKAMPKSYRKEVEKMIEAAFIDNGNLNKIRHVEHLVATLRSYGVRVDIQEPYDPERGIDK